MDKIYWNLIFKIFNIFSLHVDPTPSVSPLIFYLFLHVLSLHLFPSLSSSLIFSNLWLFFLLFFFSATKFLYSLQIHLTNSLFHLLSLSAHSLKHKIINFNQRNWSQTFIKHKFKKKTLRLCLSTDKHITTKLCVCFNMIWNQLICSTLHYNFFNL